MKSSFSANFPILVVAMILVIAIGIHHADAKKDKASKRSQGSHQDRVAFVAITNPATEETCAMDYAARDTNGLVEMASGRFSQELLGTMGVSNQFTVCFRRTHGRNSDDFSFSAKSFVVENVLHATKV